MSDDPAPIIPDPPDLSLQLPSTNLQLTARGSIECTCLVMEALTPTATTWTNIHTVKLTSGEQAIPIPIPASGPRFWRVQVQ